MLRVRASSAVLLVPAVRIRQVKPAFWTDSRIAELSAPCRLFYIGLWMLADDAGWFRADVPSIGVELYGYETRTRRERSVAAFLEALGASGRIVLLPCGHGYIPAFSEHQRLAGETKRVVSVKRDHESCPHTPATPRVSPLIPDTVRSGTVSSGKGQERNGQSRASDPEGPRAISEFQSRVPRPA